MAVVFDAAGTAQQGPSGTSASIPITLGTAANRVVIVQWDGATDTVGLAASIVGGETLSMVPGSDGTTTTATAILGTATTKTGAITVSVTWTTSQVFVVNAMSFSGASGSFNGGTFGSGASPFNTVVTSVDGDMTTTVMNTFGATLTTNQTLQWGPILQSLILNAGDTGPGTGTTTHTWSSNMTIFGSGANVMAAVGTYVLYLGRK